MVEYSMRIKNVSNYPRIVAGVRIEPGETEEVEVEEDRLQDLKNDGKLEIEDDSEPEPEPVEDDGEDSDSDEEVKTEEKNNDSKKGE